MGFPATNYSVFPLFGSIMTRNYTLCIFGLFRVICYNILQIIQMKAIDRWSNYLPRLMITIGMLRIF